MFYSPQKQQHTDSSPTMNPDTYVQDSHPNRTGRILSLGEQMLVRAPSVPGPYSDPTVLREVSFREKHGLKNREKLSSMPASPLSTDDAVKVLEKHEMHDYDISDKNEKCPRLCNEIIAVAGRLMGNSVYLDYYVKKGVFPSDIFMSRVHPFILLKGNGTDEPDFTFWNGRKFIGLKTWDPYIGMPQFKF